MKRKEIILEMGQQELERKNANGHAQAYQQYLKREEAFVEKYLKEHQKEFEELMWEKLMYYGKKELYAYQKGFIKGAKLMMEILMH